MPETIQLPDVVKFVLPAQHAAVILNALQESGPFKAVKPVIENLQQQLLGQQVRERVVAPPSPTSLNKALDDAGIDTGVDANGSEVGF